MEKSLINASLSTENLTFRRGASPVSFEVTVNNDSDQFVNFQLEVLAAGENRNSNYSWYKLTPEVAAAQPHGSSTQFQVLIFDTPIPGFVGIVNLTVNIFSPQLRQQRRLLLRLKIESDGQPTALRVDLPVRSFQVYPRNSVDIPVRVSNLGQQSVNVVLRFAGIDPSWVVGGGERRLLLDPGAEAEVSFQCQAPSVAQAPSQNYPFTIEATGNNSIPAKGEGGIEVLPIGFVEFKVAQKHEKLPSKGRWIIDWKSKSATFELLFKNASNLNQEINLKLQGRDWRKCTFEMNPQNANLNIGGTTKTLLDVKTKRPWIGPGKTLLLEAKPELSDQRLGSTDPATQTLELEIFPIIPLWLQLALLALLAALLAWLLRPSSVYHTDIVKSVRFSGDGLSVISGSQDCTLRRWDTSPSLKPEGMFSQSPIACTQLQNPKGLLATPNHSVEIVRISPVNNDRVAAGLDTGVIQILNVPTQEKIQEFHDKTDTKGDRVFDLIYNKDSTKLYSAHGSGKVRLWTAPLSNGNFNQDPELVIDLQNKLHLPKFVASNLALSPDEKIIIVGGSSKRFVLWRLDNQLKKPLLSQQTFEKLVLDNGEPVDTGEDKFVSGLVFITTPKNESSNENILATSDSDGFITIWNLDQCQGTKNGNIKDEIPELNCPLIARWQTKQGFLNSLAFSKERQMLVSGGDDGRVMAWFLTREHTLDTTEIKGREIDHIRQKITSVDIFTNNQGTMIVSGGKDHQVRLYHLQ